MDNDDKIEEPDEFRIRHSQVMTVLAMKYAFWPIVILLCLFLALIAVGCFLDLKWLVVALALIFLVAPMLLCFLYIVYALRPFTAYNTLPHTIASTPDGLLLTIKRTPLSSSDKENQNETALKKVELPVSEQPLPDLIISIPESKITATEFWGGTKILHIGVKAREGLLFLPE